MTDQPPTLTELRETASRLELQARVSQLQAATRLFESQQILDSYVDPREAYWDDEEGRFWLAAGSTDRKEASQALNTEEALTAARRICRRLAELNEFAINAIENRISYVVGTGYKWRVVARHGETPSDAVIAAGTGALDSFADESDWSQLEQELHRRVDRDGEVFLRWFRPVGIGDVPKVRVVEPGQVARPTGGLESGTFGVITAVGDVQTVEAYYVDGRYTPAEEIDHLKANVDRNVKRGMPTLWPIRKNLERAEKLLRNMSSVATVQAAIAIVRKHENRTLAGIQRFADDQADFDVTNQLTGKTKRFQKFGPGEVIDAPAGTSYEFPSHALNAGAFVTVLKAELRSIAARLVMPEFMLTSDASNAAFASAMVAEGPAVKMFQRLQTLFMSWLRGVLYKRVIVPALGEQARLVTIEAAAPHMIVRDRLKESQARQIEVREGVLSPQLWAGEMGRDYEQVATDLEDHADRFGTAGPVPPLTPPTPAG